MNKKNNLINFIDARSIRMLLLGFSAGLPILLVFSTLSVWLIKAGVNRSTVTLFSWAGFAYSFKFIWTPLVDNLKLPLFGKLGHRKGWLLFSQLMIVISLIFTSTTDPSKTLLFTALGIVCVAFSSATQDIVIDAFRIESAPQKLQGALSSMYIAGYRIAMLVAGAGSLWLAAFLGLDIYNANVWKTVYLVMASLMSIGIITTLFSPEPKLKRQNIKSFKNQIKFILVFIIAIITFIIIYSNLNNTFLAKDCGMIKFLCEQPLNKFLFGMFKIITCLLGSALVIYILTKLNFISKKIIYNSYANPILDFINRYKKVAIAILILIALYRIADVVMGVMANIFYLEKGFNVKEIATYSKFFGVFATIVGGFAGGYSAIKMGTIKALFIGAVVAAASNLLFAWLAVSSTDIKLLIFVITADNISSGFAGAAFVVYLSALTSIKFTATQYALFSSIMLFLPKLLAGYAGGMVDIMGYANFYVFTAILGVPVLFLIFWISKIAPIK